MITSDITFICRTTRIDAFLGFQYWRSIHQSALASSSGGHLLLIFWVLKLMKVINHDDLQSNMWLHYTVYKRDTRVIQVLSIGIIQLAGGHGLRFRRSLTNIVISCLAYRLVWDNGDICWYTTRVSAGLWQTQTSDILLISRSERSVNLMTVKQDYWLICYLLLTHGLLWSWSEYSMG